jgi:signal transduction histidine kinase
MKLRNRLVFTFSVITLIAIAPALYGLFALRELRQVAYNLSTRDAVGALALGRLQAAFGEADNAERIYLAFASQPAAERAEARARVTRALLRIETELRRLSEGGYQATTSPAVEAWRRLLQAVEAEHRLVEAGEVERADVHRDEVVDPAFRAMDAALDPIGQAINAVGMLQVRQAQNIATGAATTTLLALALAMAIALAIGGWSARSLLRPVHQLRHAMAEVADGNLEPELGISPSRPDEIGDLARSFAWMTKKLAELERLRAQFVAVASHELKTPLSVIQGYVALLRDGIYGDVQDEQRQILGSVGDQTDRLARLIQQLLDISRFEAGGGRLEIQTIALDEFTRELASSFEVLAIQNEIDFNVELEKDAPTTIEGDPDRLNEVLGNLLSNAFKFTPRHGRIDLRVRADPRKDESSVLLEVTDTGVGIPEEQLPRVFEKFFQVENEAQPKSVGSGLGLAISREIVEAHGGTISAESEVGSGTTFKVVLPIRPPVTETA